MNIDVHGPRTATAMTQQTTTRTNPEVNVRPSVSQRGGPSSGSSSSVSTNTSMQYASLPMSFFPPEKAPLQHPSSSLARRVRRFSSFSGARVLGWLRSRLYIVSIAYRK